MDRSLANYLFHNETLYAFREEVVSGKSEIEGLKTEVGSQKSGDGSGETEDPRLTTEARSTDSRVDKIEDSNNQELVTSSPITNYPSTNSAITQAPKPPVYPMKTKHLVVVKNLQPAEKELLVKIMTAIKLKMDIVDLVDVANYPNIDFKETIYGNMPKAILFFGPESGEEFLIRLKLEKYSPKVLKGINFLMADNLGTILKDQNNEKRLLWNCLKEVFEV